MKIAAEQVKRQGPMKPYRTGSATTIALLSLLALQGCNEGSSPTAPLPVPDTTPPGGSQFDLTGPWEGTITYDEDLVSPEETCPPEAMKAEVRQAGTHVSVYFILRGCVKFASLEGDLRGTQLTGLLSVTTFDGEVFRGSSAGSVSASRIQVETGKLDGGQGSILGNSIVLTR